MAKFQLDQALLTKLSTKIGKTIKYTREQITKRASRNNVSSEAYFVFWLRKEGIGAMKYYRSLPPEIQSEVRNLQSILGTKLVSSLSAKQKHRLQRIEKMFRIEKLEIKQKPFLLSKEIISQAEENSQLYPALFILENSIRNLIIVVLTKKYGSTWWNTKVSKKIKEDVSQRIKEEQLNPWRGTRGATPIFYTNFSDLATILRFNAKDFNPIFKGITGGLNWLTRRLDELAGIRHNIAHTAPLKSKDRGLLLLYFQNFYDLLDILNQRINNICTD